jgi:hypothetical protein
MRSLHRVPMPPKWQRPDLSKAALARRRSPVSVAAPYQQPPWRIHPLADAARSLPSVDAGLVHAAEEMVVDRLLLFASDTHVVVHGDLHWDNLLSDAEQLTGLLDFEQAQSATPDLELDVLLRFSAWPQLPVAPDYQHELEPVMFRHVPDWLAGGYPELFSSAYLRQRLEVYAVMHDLRQGIQFPPAPGREYPPWATWNRLRTTLDGTSYLRDWT